MWRKRDTIVVSGDSMNDMGLTTIAYEAGQVPPSDVALDLTHHFNQIISALVVADPITPQRHQMAYANLGDSFGGSWRNEVEKPNPQPRSVFDISPILW